MMIPALYRVGPALFSTPWDARAYARPHGLAMDRASARIKDRDGRLHVTSTVLTRACVSPYLGSEIPGWAELNLEPDKIYRVLRHPDALADAVDSFNNLPLLSEHTPVTAQPRGPQGVRSRCAGVRLRRGTAAGVGARGGAALIGIFRFDPRTGHAMNLSSPCAVERDLEMDMRDAIKWVDGRLGTDGPYRRLARYLFCIERCFSLSYRLNKKVARLLNADSVPWVSEVYQLVSLLMSFLLIFPAYYSVAATVVVLVSLYRPVEIFIFTINWLLVHRGPVRSSRRSAAGFLINLAEITLFFAAAELGSGCICRSHGASDAVHVISSAIYSSLRTVVTIGPTEVCDDGVICMAILSLQIVVGFSVIVGAIANVVGAIDRSGRVDDQTSGG